jgi:hypothetical protein
VGWADGTSRKKVKASKPEKKAAKRDAKFEKCTRCRDGQKFCQKHLKESKAAASRMGPANLQTHDEQGRNLLGIRYDKDGKRIW